MTDTDRKTDPNSKIKRVSFWLNQDKTMRTLNQKLFSKDEPTDVISLNLNEVVPEKGEYVGEIAVNQDAVRRHAKKYGVSYEQELARAVAHGVLHLLGYDDQDPQGKKEMKLIEDQIVQKVK